MWHLNSSCIIADMCFSGEVVAECPVSQHCFCNTKNLTADIIEPAQPSHCALVPSFPFYPIPSLPELSEAMECSNTTSVRKMSGLNKNRIMLKRNLRISPVPKDSWKYMKDFPWYTFRHRLCLPLWDMELIIHHQYLIRNRSFSFHPHVMKMIRSHQHILLLLLHQIIIPRYI